MLRETEPKLMRQHFGVVMERTCKELRPVLPVARTKWDELPTAKA